MAGGKEGKVSATIMVTPHTRARGGNMLQCLQHNQCQQSRTACGASNQHHKCTKGTQELRWALSQKRERVDHLAVLHCHDHIVAQALRCTPAVMLMSIVAAAGSLALAAW